ENDDGKPWIPCCDLFSTYVFTRVFENQFWSTDNQGGGINCACECFPNLIDSDLEFMRSRFCEEPSTHLVDQTNIYHFSDGWGKRVTFYATDYGATIALTASDSASFQSLKATLLPRWDFSEEK